MNRQSTEEPTTAAGGRHADLAAELVSFMGLAFADAFHCRLMNTVDFVLVVPFLMKDSGRSVEQGLELIVRLRALSFDIPNDAPKIGLQRPGAPSGSFHLPGMRLPALLEQKVFRLSVVVLP